MTLEEKIQENLNEWLESEYWREYYETAPSEQAKEYIRWDLYYSETEDRSVLKKLNALEKKFTVEDWEHQLKYNGHNPRVLYIRKKIRELEEKHGS